MQICAYVQYISTYKKLKRSHVENDKSVPSHKDAHLILKIKKTLRNSLNNLFHLKYDQNIDDTLVIIRIDS